ncbi:type II toxin-antitoxin system VapC family toxin [Altericista sp. CCNU0014]|uniref:type II toxin-antitoxin system VapC family toxin n=1 Tax=Altericista sp. CCNU0014 TaxID=3082949 RepID=UPI00384F573C
MLFVAHVTWVEVCSAVARRQREGSVSDVHANQILMAFRDHWDVQYFTAAIDKTIIELAGQLVKMHPLRAYDAVQLAAALSIRNEIKFPSRASFHFLTADDRLLAIAQAENLLVDNPNWHP